MEAFMGCNEAEKVILEGDAHVIREALVSEPVKVGLRLACFGICLVCACALLDLSAN